MKWHYYCEQCETSSGGEGAQLRQLRHLFLRLHLFSASPEAGAPQEDTHLRSFLLEHLGHRISAEAEGRRISLSELIA